MSHKSSLRLTSACHHISLDMIFEPNTSMSHPIPYESGRTEVLYEPCVEMVVASDGTTLTTFSNSSDTRVDFHQARTRKRKRSHTPESPARNKRKISNDRSRSCDNTIRHTRLCLTLDPDSITKDTAIIPFWTNACAEWSRKLPSFTKTDGVALDLNSRNKYLRTTALDSWFTTNVWQADLMPVEKWNLLKISSLLSQSLRHDIMGKEAIKDFMETGVQKDKRLKRAAKDKHLAIDKVRIFPTESEQTMLKKWLGTHRWSYNRCVAMVKNNNGTNKQGYRDAITKQDARCFVDDPLLKWVFETPQMVRDDAICEFMSAVSSNHALKRKNPSYKFRSKKDKSQVFHVPSRDYNRLGGMFKFLKDIKASEDLSYAEHTVGFQKTWLNEWYILVPVKREVPPPENLPKRVISIDPGVRTFVTCYDTDGYVSEWGKADLSRIYRLCRDADDLQSRTYTTKDVHVTAKQRRNRKKAFRRIYRTIHNLVDELHKKVINWLVHMDAVILLPVFETSKMAKRSKRKLNSKTARGMLTWSHFRFRQRLLNKIYDWPTTKVVLVNEAYTSKTCGCCGFIHQKLSSNKLFKCPQCGFTCDRDFNGARNILLRYLSRSVKLRVSDLVWVSMHVFDTLGPGPFLPFSDGRMQESYSMNGFAIGGESRIYR